MQYPGNNTVTFTFPGVESDRLHHVQAQESTSFSQQGCYVDPVSVRDKISDTAYTQATDKIIVLANEDTLSVKAEWFATFNNLDYRVLGAKLFYDSWGRPYTITFYCKDETPSGGVVE